MGGALELNKEIIERIANKHYNIAGDRMLFDNAFSAQLRVRGYLTRAELVDIVAWKAHRQKTNVAKNDDETIELVTRRAFSETDPRLAAWTLRYLFGVSTRMASAILTVYDPNRYTVMDVRAWATLSNLSLPSIIGAEIPKFASLDSCATYGWYLETCKKLANHYDVELRTLDRCLFSLKGSEPQALLAADKLTVRKE